MLRKTSGFISRFGLDSSIMDTDDRALRAVAQTYLDAAYEMDGDKFASVFHPTSCVTKVGVDGAVSVTPLAAWLAALQSIKSPKQQGVERRDEISSVIVENDLALVKLKFQIPPRHFIDLLSCLKINGTWKVVQKVFVVTTNT